LGLQKIYRDGFKYKKAGVIVSGIIPEDEYQLALFSPNPDNNARRVMQVLDAINHSNGRTS
jgi:DNA polymerase V